MNRILPPILLLTLLFPSLALGESMGDLVVRNGLHYKKFSDVPFTGKVTGKSQGSFRTEGSFKDGKKDGRWVSYYPDGRLFYKGTYKDDKKVGPWVDYWDAGKLMHKGTYKDDKKDGPWVGYWIDGTVWSSFTGTFKDGVKVK